MQTSLKKVRIPDLARWKRQGRKITMLTAYDATMAALLDRAGIDVLLVGDSLGMVVLGHETTIPVTLDAMVHHSAAVTRGAGRALVIADMPFLTYQVSEEQSLRNAARLMQEGGVHAVKLEGGRPVAAVIRRLVDTGIPVMGHLGLTPQSVHQLGGYGAVGKTEEDAAKMMEDALCLQDAGAFGIVLEAIPADLAGRISTKLTIPTIGIGAGPQCDGQVLVSYDALGMDESFKPRFVRRYETLGDRIKTAIGSYVADVRSGAFPAATESFSVAENKATPTNMEAPYSSVGKK
jgi:3-methyl-2-oxobutanoate hydroxymethyltransferase